MHRWQQQQYRKDYTQHSANTCENADFARPLRVRKTYCWRLASAGAACRDAGCAPRDETFHKIDAGDYYRLQAYTSQQHERHGHMDGQPGHFLSRPGVDEKTAHKPVHQEQAEARRSDDTAHDADQPEDQPHLLVQWYNHQVVIPWLVAARDLLLLYPVVEALPDAISNATAHIRSEERRVGKECRSRWS